MLGLYSPEEILKIPSHPHTPVHSRKPNARAYPRTSVHTCTLEHTPHKHTHALNLINHMKLHVNRPNTKKTRKEEEDRKKKEQESAEAINGLKKLYTHFQFLLTILVTVVIRQVFSLCLPLVL